MGATDLHGEGMTIHAAGHGGKELLVANGKEAAARTRRDGGGACDCLHERHLAETVAGTELGHLVPVADSHRERARPNHFAVLPQLARSPEQLVSANALSTIAGSRD